MSLLQAAMAGGFVMMILLGLLLLIGVPVLTTILMRMYWKVSGKKGNGQKKFYKDIIPLYQL